MKKIFIVTGEVSGDRLGAWYLRRRIQEEGALYAEAVGGNFLRDAGATLYCSYQKLNIVGVVELLRHIPAVLSYLRELVDYITAQGFDEVILIDAPGFNLRLAKRLKKHKPDLKITYVSPPQLWVWGAWRARTIRKCCDEVEVLYPFEVEWYAKRGIVAGWRGYPWYDGLKAYARDAKPQKQIALLIGSRSHDMAVLLPLYVQVIKRFKLAYPDVRVVMPLAASFSADEVARTLRHAGINVHSDVKLITDEAEKYRALASSCMAITKPGTISLELALLGVPSIVVYKVSRITYALAWLIVKVPHMSLPNLFLKRELSKELMQGDCNVETVFSEARQLYESFLKQDASYEKHRAALQEVQAMLAAKDVLRTEKFSASIS